MEMVVKEQECIFFCVLPPGEKTLFCNAIHGKIVNFYNVDHKTRLKMTKTRIQHYLLFTEKLFLVDSTSFK